MSRVPRGVANPRPEAYAGCRVCCEDFIDGLKSSIIVDNNG